ncbi:NDP-sugar synthase [Streptomyces solisilvae]|uniref:nucleotidyltransferase family protein n=1 Tax=Streptomyces malaysiensis TaxID=92644 RepID=UPI0036B5BEAF
MEPPITQAIILAGGRAERMRPYSDAMPKALMPIGGLAMITRQLLHLERNGIVHVVISSHYQHRKISEHVGGGSPYALNVRHAVDPYPLGTAGAVRYAHQALEDPARPFLVVNGSVSTDMPLVPFFERHAQARASATMALVRYTSERPVAMESDNGRIRALPKVQLLPYWTDSGLTVLQPYTVKMLPEVGEITDMFETVAAEGLLAAYHAPDEVFWRELATVGDLYTYPDSPDG